MAESFSNYAETSIKANRRFANLDGLSFFCINFFVVTVYWLSGGRISAGHLQIGDITAVIEYAMMVLFFLMMTQMVILTLPRALECCERIREVLDHSPEITDMVTENPAKSEKEDDKKKEVLAFKDVSFRFADAEENTLHRLNFTCRRGETTAIIGGTDIREVTQDHLRDHIGYVQQKAWLFSGTIADNLRYSRPNATDEELMHGYRHFTFLEEPYEPHRIVGAVDCNPPEGTKLLDVKK